MKASCHLLAPSAEVLGNTKKYLCCLPSNFNASLFSVLCLQHVAWHYQKDFFGHSAIYWYCTRQNAPLCQDEYVWKCLISFMETSCNGGWVMLFILQDCKLQLVLTAVHESALCCQPRNLFTYFTSNLQFFFFCD